MKTWLILLPCIFLQTCMLQNTRKQAEAENKQTPKEQKTNLELSILKDR